MRIIEHILVALQAGNPGRPAEVRTRLARHVFSLGGCCVRAAEAQGADFQVTGRV